MWKRCSPALRRFRHINHIFVRNLDAMATGGHFGKECYFVACSGDHEFFRSHNVEGFSNLSWESLDSASTPKVDAFTIKIFMKCDGQARDILLHSFDVLLSDLRRCPVDSLVRITNLGCNHVFIVSRGSTFTTPESYKYIERLAKVMPVDLEPTEEKKTFQTTTPFELLDSVLRVLTLGQIQRELSVTNSQESE
eukprot:TRINITY_DN8854_c0_g1_i4.p1 TRINITY_DN8854_c0_g1~~TRINITY_DN8854_c0_g1_i4.p1  ORF type:complete len:194 (-),score=12.51 TRINITY_DN8854_c0_g1_i4:35-616(-)